MSTEGEAARIRPYEPRDREAVRTICCDTADRGEPVESFFPDREVFADLLTAYYTDFEPESGWVGDRAGEVIGYLTGCLDTRRFIRIMAFSVSPRLLIKAIRREVLKYPQAKQFVRSNLGLWLRGTKKNVSFDEYPSHLHINLKQGARAQGLGCDLVTRFLVQAKAAGSCGVHANVREDSERARKFFESLGFEAAGRHPVMAKAGEILYAVTYCRKLQPEQL
jgi:ribosomal protein S18 acetylase RimI-like enzyme